MIFPKTELIDSFIEELKLYYDNPNEYKFTSGNLLSRLQKEEIEYLNQNLELDKIVGCSKNNILNTLINDKSKDNFTFYILFAKEIEVDVNHYNKIKTTNFIDLSKRIFFDDTWDFFMIKNLLDRGYKIKLDDDKYTIALYNEGFVKSNEEYRKWAKLRLAVKLKEGQKLEKAYTKIQEIYTILSFKEKKPRGSNLSSLLEIAINAIQNYKENGDIILKAIQVYNIEEELVRLDRNNKKTYPRKKAEYLKNPPHQDKEFEEIVKELFPEIK